jgi:hypothetical protein
MDRSQACCWDDNSAECVCSLCICGYILQEYDCEESGCIGKSNYGQYVHYRLPMSSVLSICPDILSRVSHSILHIAFDGFVVIYNGWLVDLSDVDLVK